MFSKPIRCWLFCIMLFINTISGYAQVYLNHAPGFQPLGHNVKPLLRTVETAQNYGSKLLWAHLDFNLDPRIRMVNGTATFLLQPTPFAQSYLFDLSDSISVNAVNGAGGKPIAFTHANNVLTLSILPKGANPSPDTIVISYGGVPPTGNGFGAFETGITDTTEKTAVLWTLSQPYGAKDWWPTHNGLTDKLDSLTITIHCPQGWVGIANGVRVDSTTHLGVTTIVWKHNYPIVPYLVAVAVGPYRTFNTAVARLDGSTMTVQNHAYPKDYQQWTNDIQSLPSIFDLFQNKFGPYPFATELYAHTQFPWPGGMEHQTNSFMYDLNFELVSHELAHQWFGDKVTCGSWQDIWLNEGFATYASGICYENLLNGFYWPIWKTGVVNYILRDTNGSVFRPDTTSVPTLFDYRLTYLKAAYVLHMLRYEVGTSNFYSALKAYLNDPKLAYGFSQTADLQRHFEAQCNCNLSYFFEQWVFGQGNPIYTAKWYRYGKKVFLNTIQTQSHPSVALYKGKLPVTVYGNQGADSIEVSVNVLQASQWHTFDVPFTPDSVRINASLWHLTAPIAASFQQGTGAVYPNPTNGYFIYQPAFDAPYTAEIFNTAGQSIAFFQQLKWTHTFDVTNWVKGVYVLNIKSSQHMQQFKIVIP